MLRTVVKLATKSATLLGRNPQLRRINIPKFSVIPQRFFCTNEPPKGFDKFKRKGTKGDTKPKEESVESVDNQRIDPLEGKKEEAVNPTETQGKEPKEPNENKNKKEKKEEKKTEKEEQIENDEQDGKKSKKESTWSSFNWNSNGKFFDPKMPSKFNWKYVILASMLGYIGMQLFDQFADDRDSISYTDFLRNYLETDRVTKIDIRRINHGGAYKSVAIIHTATEGVKTLVLGNVDHFLENLEKYQLERGKTPERLIPIQFDYKVDTGRIMGHITSFFSTFCWIAMLYMSFRQLKNMGVFGKGGSGNDIFSYGKSQAKIYGIDNKIKTKFRDVAGLEEAKVEIMEFVDFLKKPKRFKDIGAKIPRGALLTGPPGTGKTLLAKAAAGEAGVPFLYISGSDFVEMFVGVGASRVRDLFKKAKENAPAIIFIDEIDAVGRKRESKMGGNDERDNTLNQLLVEMDGFGTDTSVVVMAATNRKELLDPALTRPGRLDRSIEITLPDIEGRKEIFMVHLKPLQLDPSKTLEQYAKRLATLTPGFSGAEISNLCNEAAILAARRNKKFVSSEEFEAASERVLAGLEKKKMVSEEERKVVAVHESGHAVVSWFLEGGAPLLKLTIIPRSKGSLGFAQYLPNESSLESKEELLDRICCILGGRCSEEFFNGRITTGAYDDLKKAYDIAHAMITKFGMSEKVGFIGFADDQYFRKVSDQTAKDIDDEIKRIINECTARTREVIKTHKVQIEKLSQKLLEKETLDLQAIIEVLGERPFAPKSNFKAFLENKREQEEEMEENKNKEEKQDEDEDSDSRNKERKPARQTA